MKKLLFYMLVFFLSAVLGGNAFAQPADLGEACFQSESSEGHKSVYRVEVTDMGNEHYAINGYAEPKSEAGGESAVAAPEPVHGVAEVKGDSIYMTLSKASVAKNATSEESSMRADSIHIELEAATLSGTFRMIRRVHDIEKDTDWVEHVSGSFGLCP